MASNNPQNQKTQWFTQHDQIPIQLQIYPFWMRCGEGPSGKETFYHNRPSKWLPWKDALQYPMLSFKYEPTHPVICIDLDDLDDPPIQEFVSKYPTYSEASPSGSHKAHIIYQISPNIDKNAYSSKPKRHNGKTELFLYNHYTTITGNRIDSPLYSRPEITELTEDQTLELLELFPNASKIRPIDNNVLQSNPIFLSPDVQKALAVIDTWIEVVELDPSHPRVKAFMDINNWNHYEYWLKGLQVIHYIYSGRTEGTIKADQWSQKHPESYSGLESVINKWNSFTAEPYQGLTEKTFFMFLNHFLLAFPEVNEKGQPILNSYANFLAVLAYSSVTPAVDAISLVPHFEGPDSVLYPHIYENFQEKQEGHLKSVAKKSFQLCLNSGLRITPANNYSFVEQAFGIIKPSEYTHPFRSYMDSAPWDGIDRIKTLIDAYKLEPDNPASRLAPEFIRRWLYSIIRTFYSMPNRYALSGAEGMLIITGPERTKKTSSFRAILPKQFSHYHVEANLNLDGGSHEKDALQKMLSALIVNCDEVESTFSTSKQPRLKSILSATKDTFRAPYEAGMSTHKRLCSFCGTTNYTRLTLPDDGARRYWIMSITDIDLDQILSIDSQQMWAQVKAELLKKSETEQHPPWLLSSELLKEQSKLVKGYKSTSSTEDTLVDAYNWADEAYFARLHQDTRTWSEKTRSVAEICKDLNIPRSGDIKHCLDRLCKMYVTQTYRTKKGETIKNGKHYVSRQDRYIMPPLRSLQNIDQESSDDIE